MSKWKEYKLSDFVQFGNGKERPKTEGNIPVFGGNGILGYCDKSNYDEETIIIGRVGAYCGSVYYQVKPIWVSDNALAAKPKNNNNTKFLYYFLKNLDLNSFAEGSSHPLVTQTLLNSLDIYVTDNIETQTAIAEVLSSLDDKIDLLHRQNKTLEQLAETLFRQWFVEEAEESWEADVLDNIIELQRGISYSGLTLGEKGEGLPMHNLNSIDTNGSYKYEGIKYYKGEAKSKQLLRPGDLLIINTDITQDNRIIGWPVFVPEEFEISVSTHHLYSVSLKSDKVSKLFLYHLLRHRNYREALANASNGTTVSMLSKEAIGGIEVKISPKEKRLKFEEQVSSFQKKQTENQKQIRTLTQLRDTLLPKLMSGEVRIINDIML
jgi:type I restriction enzyme S subunit